MRASSLVCLLALVGCAAAKHQGAFGVEGKLMCGTKPAEDVRIRLCVEHAEKGHVPILLAEGKTGADGAYSLKANVSQEHQIEARLILLTDCADGILPGARLFTFDIPQQYVERGVTETKKICPMGVINLELKHEKEQRELENPYTP